MDIEVGDVFDYLESKAFITGDGEPVIDIVFLCCYKSGTPRIVDAAEVAALQWMTAQEVLDHPKTPPWTGQSIRLAEVKRCQGLQD